MLPSVTVHQSPHDPGITIITFPLLRAYSFFVTLKHSISSKNTFGPSFVRNMFGRYASPHAHSIVDQRNFNCFGDASKLRTAAIMTIRFVGRLRVRSCYDQVSHSYSNFDRVRHAETSSFVQQHAWTSDRLGPCRFDLKPPASFHHNSAQRIAQAHSLYSSRQVHARSTCGHTAANSLTSCHFYQDQFCPAYLVVVFVCPLPTSSVAHLLTCVVASYPFTSFTFTIFRALCLKV